MARPGQAPPPDQGRLPHIVRATSTVSCLSTSLRAYDLWGSLVCSRTSPPFTYHVKLIKNILKILWYRFCDQSLGFKENHVISLINSVIPYIPTFHSQLFRLGPKNKDENTRQSHRAVTFFSTLNRVKHLRPKEKKKKGWQNSILNYSQVGIGFLKIVSKMLTRDMKYYFPVRDGSEIPYGDFQLLWHIY